MTGMALYLSNVPSRRLQSYGVFCVNPPDSHLTGNVHFQCIFSIQCMCSLRIAGEAHWLLLDSVFEYNSRGDCHGAKMQFATFTGTYAMVNIASTRDCFLFH